MKTLTGLCVAFAALGVIGSNAFDILQPGDDFYSREIDYVASLKSRLTGSPNHTTFIDYLERELKSLGLRVHSDHFTFQYNVPPTTALSLTVDGQLIKPASYVPYSGNTNSKGVNGRLVPLDLPSSAGLSPNWSEAAGNIAVLDIYNTPLDGPALLPVWPEFPDFGVLPGVPAVNSGVRNLTAAAAAGVKGVIYNWLNISDFNAYGQYAPFKLNYQGVPAVYVTDQSMKQAGAHNGSEVTITSVGNLVQHAHTRTLYVVVEGRHQSEESVILSTHTDGTNAVEENGHIPLLAKARQLASSPPRRTTILVFVTGHLHTSGFTDTGRVMERWLQDHPDLWAGNSSSAKKAIFGSCVEHLGANSWQEDLAHNIYYPTGGVMDEWLYANTPELADLLGHEWKGTPGPLRVINPKSSPLQQSGEGLPFAWNGIPEVSTCTSPDWLLKTFPAGFDERLLMDKATVRRQTESFLRLWEAVDAMPRKSLGVAEKIIM